MLDQEARSSFERAASGGFLCNGARLYIDAVGNHLEYATPECLHLFDIVLHERAGQRIIQQSLEELGLSDHVNFYNNSVDHFGGHTFGCHENYSVEDADYLAGHGRFLFLPFLVTRQIFAGAGRVGGHRLVSESAPSNIMRPSRHIIDIIGVGERYGVAIDRDIRYQLSQRADHIRQEVAGRVRFNRAIITPRYGGDQSQRFRLHLLYGEGNMSQYAFALRMGTTRLVLDLLERDLVPLEVVLANPLQALRDVSRDVTWNWIVQRSDGSTIDAIDLQRYYLEAAQQHLRGQDADTDWVLEQWEEVLDKLERDPYLLADRLDWVAKLSLIELFMQEEKVDWDTDMLQSLDLAYHNIDPTKGLYYGLEQQGTIRTLVSEADVLSATRTPPRDTRAVGRGTAISTLIERDYSGRYTLDWNSVSIHGFKRLELYDPTHTYLQEATRYIERISSRFTK